MARARQAGLRPTLDQLRAQLHDRLAGRAEIDWAYLFGSALVSEIVGQPV